MSNAELRAWLWGSGTACIATGSAFSLHNPAAGDVGGVVITIGAVLCVKAYLTKI